MAKKKIKQRNSRLRDIAGLAVVLVPAILAAVTAFMNTAFARDNGLSWDDLADGQPGSKSRKRSKRA